MLKQLMFGAVVCMAGVALAADASEEVTSACQKLTDASNYSWKQTAENAGGGGFGAGTQEGKTEKDGYTLLNLTMGDNSFQVAMKGSKGVVKTDDGWKTSEELADEQGPARFLGMMARNYKAPADQAKDAASKAKELKHEEDVYSADLTGDDAKAMFMMGMRGRRGGGNGGQAPEITNPKVSLKFWVKDGVLSKYQIHTSGTISFNGNDRDIDRTTTVEISDVGNTKVEVPDEAKKKLG